MKRILYLLLFIFLLSSCVKEYNNFYPYRNYSLSYLHQLQNETISFEFPNDSSFKHQMGNGIIIEIPANSFSVIEKKLILKLDIRSTIGDLVENRISLTKDDNSLFTGELLLNYDILDGNNQSVSLNDNYQILFKIPFNNVQVPSLFKYNSEHWELANTQFDNIIKSTWYTGSVENPILQKGYIFSTSSKGLFCLGNNIENEKEISDFRVKLPENYTVENSIVQLILPDSKSNIELFWDNEHGSFRLPPNVNVPTNNVGIIALSENSSNQAFFGMKYAQIKNGEVFSLALERKRVEEIKSILDSL